MFDILFPLTGTFTDESALPHALEMARASGATVHLVRVLESRRASDRPIDPVDWHIKKLDAESALERAAERFEQAGVRVEGVLLEGHPTEHLIDYAHRSGAELLVLAGGSGNGTIGALGGELLWRSYLTTLLVRPEPPERDDAPSQQNRSDRSETFERGLGLGARPGQAAASGANRLGAALTRVSVRSWTPGAVRGGSGGAPADAYGVPAPAGAYAPAAPGSAGLAVAQAGSGLRPRPASSEFDDTARPTTALERAASGGTPPQRAAAADGRQGGVLSASDAAGFDARMDDDYDAEPEEQPEEGVRYRRILTALDGSKRAECVLPWVRRLAQQHEAEVILAHVVTEPELPRLTPPSPEDVELARRLVERNRDAGTDYLGDARKRLGVEADTRLLQGKPAEALHDFVEREEIDLVVLSAHGYGGESRWPFGDVATSFIGYGRTPLLLVQDMEHQPPQSGSENRWGS